MVGAFLALGLTAVFAGLSAETSTTAIVLDASIAKARATFVVSSGWLYTLVLVLGALIGTVVAAIVYAFEQMRAPDEDRIPLRWLLALSATSGAIMAYGVLRAGVGLNGDIAAGRITISVFRGLATALAAGAVTGGVSAWLVGIFDRRAALGFEGAARPASTAEFLRTSGRAVLVPILAIVATAAAAVGFSQVLLQLHGSAAVAVFSAIPALILLLAAAAAYRK
jgi:hypothetical protein